MPGDDNHTDNVSRLRMLFISKLIECSISASRLSVYLHDGECQRDASFSSNFVNVCKIKNIKIKNNYADRESQQDVEHQQDLESTVAARSRMSAVCRPVARL